MSPQEPRTSLKEESQNMGAKKDGAAAAAGGAHLLQLDDDLVLLDQDLALVGHDVVVQVVLQQPVALAAEIAHPASVRPSVQSGARWGERETATGVVRGNRKNEKIIEAAAFVWAWVFLVEQRVHHELNPFVEGLKHNRYSREPREGSKRSSSKTRPDRSPPSHSNK